MKTTPFPSALEVTALMTSAVNVSQPLPAWEYALCARTVREVLSQSTPERAIGLRSLTIQSQRKE